MEDFESLRPLLFSIAYRMTGGGATAEDLVQEAFLRYRERAPNDVRSLKAYLATTVTHLAIDHLTSARARREQYLGPWLPEPVLTAGDGLAAADRIEQQELLSLAWLILLESLTPAERAVFVLHEAFDYPFGEIAAMLGKAPATCRQLFHRAKDEVARHRQRFSASPEVQRELLAHFLQACQGGDLAALTTLLVDGVVARSDGGGIAPAAIQPVLGASAVARFLIGLARKLGPTAAVTIEPINGSTAALLWEGGALTTVISLTIADGRIAEVISQRNPNKLAFLGRQLRRRAKLASVP